MCVDLVIVDETVEALANLLKVISHFIDKKVSCKLFVPIFLVELDDA
jgi:hypothetical protein